MSVIISKKKKEEFNNIFFSFNSNNFFLNIELFRKLFNSDFYNIFIEYIDEKIKTIVNSHNNFYLHINISSFNLSDMYNYDKILLFAELLHKFTLHLTKIHLYGSSGVFTNLIFMISNSLNFDITNKLVFEKKDNFEIKTNQFNIYDK